MRFYWHDGVMKKIHDPNAPEDEIDAGPSKSLRKRQSHDLQALGEALIDLPQDTLDALPLPETLRDAVMLARRITKHGGLYRQKQLIGKLMRKIDAEPIRAALEARRVKHSTAARQFQLIERWRARLINEPSALDEFINAYPSAKRATLQQLVTRAHHESDNKRSPTAARELFHEVEKYIKY
ncbi:MAG TPA: ribosome biogenesis factor YjgA, partial [Steroidobacteraceae bacterium]|nr:ribosome biogenesis factor YjgA [Steroidobacteraceae bacterium]